MAIRLVLALVLLVGLVRSRPPVSEASAEENAVEPGPASPAPAADCAARGLGERLGWSHLAIGGTMADEAFASAPFDLRYLYLVGPVPSSPCATCAHACEAGGASCANEAGGCPWWGCWQWDGAPPGRYVANLIESAESAGAIPLFSYYVWLSVAETNQGWEEVAALTDPARVARYLADWRFFCRNVAQATSNPVLAHIEPDLWGFGQQVHHDPFYIPAAVSAGVAPECAGLSDTMAGFARCMLRIARAEAPNLLVGFHASSWGAGRDVFANEDPAFDVAQQADATAQFMRALGADEADLLVVEMSDRDAGAGGIAWDATNATLPSFEQAMAWAERVAANLGLAPLWWQVPYGREGLENTCDRFEDNRVDYVFTHADRFASGGALGVAFGAGIDCMTTPSTDDGHFLKRARALFANGPPCLCGICP